MKLIENNSFGLEMLPRRSLNQTSISSSARRLPARSLPRSKARESMTWPSGDSL